MGKWNPKVPLTLCSHLVIMYTPERPSKYQSSNLLPDWDVQHVPEEAPKSVAEGDPDQTQAADISPPKIVHPHGLLRYAIGKRKSRLLRKMGL